MKKLLLSLIACFAVVAANAWTVTYTNPSNWDTVYAYTYGGAGGECLGGWPGTQMTGSGSSWTISFDGAEPDNIIFNNGNGGDENQTQDLTFVDGWDYDDASKADEGVGGGDEGGSGSEWTTVPSQLYMIGGPAGWGETAANESYKLSIVADGVFAITDVDMGSGDVWFAFASEFGSWPTVNANRVAPLAKDDPFNVNGENPFVCQDASWVVSGATMNFYVNFNNHKVTTTMPTVGVNTLTNEINGEEVIYNLQGVRVTNPVKGGIYIVNGKKVVR